MKLFNSNLILSPKFIEAQGAFLVDTKNQRVFDAWLGSGTLLFGHERVSDVFLDYKSPFLLPDGPGISDELLAMMEASVSFKVGGVGFQTSGTSAIHRACRIARSVTNRKLIAVVAEFWHGSDDAFLFQGSDQRKLSSGIPDEIQSCVRFFGSIESFLSSEEQENYAAIIVEPFQGSDPRRNMMEVLGSSKNRENLKAKGVLLIADEVITGFRSCFGSCSESRRASPDIVVFGKIVGGGWPTGMVLVSEHVSAALDMKSFFWGGTFAASPIQIKMVLSMMRRTVSLDYSKIQKNLDDLVLRIDELVAGTEFRVLQGSGAFARIAAREELSSRGFVASDKTKVLGLRDTLLRGGIFVNNNLLVFSSIYNINESQRS